MDATLTQVLLEYEERAAREMKFMMSAPREAVAARVDEFLICIGREAGSLVHLLTTGARTQTFVELGTSYGYSTLWLADAARITGGKVHSFELAQNKVDYARSQLQRVGLDAYVQFHVGDAVQLLQQLDVAIDFVLLDLWKNLYVKCFEGFHPKLAPGALVAADNMTFPPEARPDAASYQQHVRTRPDMESLLLSVGNGIELSRKKT